MTRTFACLLMAAAAPAFAQSADPQPPKPAGEQVITPQVDRRELKLPRFASNDISVGLLAGRYATANFGSSTVTGLRLGYHITEDVFVEGAYGRAKVTDEAFRQIFPNGGIFPTPKQNLTYYNVVAGYNLLPGEVFFGRSNAKISQGYVVAGVGSTDFAGQKRQTVVAGFGLRVVFTSWFAAQVDVRDHIYSLDLLGKRQSNHNLEATAGLTFTF
ncbi:MAG: outer membrane beta-barrel domain-containing protein [Rubrivivax sp.]|nr:outer membrane beta-barrel domain-containing protein [Rubrivivax sp.]